MQDERRTRRNWVLAGVATGSGLLIADVAHAATTQPPSPTIADDTAATSLDITTTTTTVHVGDTAVPASDSSTSSSAPSTPIPANDVGTGLAPVPDTGAIVAQGGPVLSTVGPIVGNASTASLPVTGQSMEMPLGSGVALALIGAALLRLRRRPDWD